ncbi:hypothetical protein SLEP1_g6073 [Rubroshorea leprosula]|uniref:Uncharacterized protein n=1 Tax=Rubroshorea leprosula TaxID=152421 RepID=A0AAV5HZY1_9ROSI|nr:hypothetical protein SLEP1_g6073 [Rubroshorea leprosula]
MTSKKTHSHFLCFALIFVLGFSASLASARSLPEPSISERFEQWLAQYGRLYKDTAEKENRFQNFQENVKYFESHNANTGKKYKLGINAFTDLTKEEFKAMRNGYKPRSSRNLFSSSKSSSFKYENASLAAVPPQWIGKRKEPSLLGVLCSGSHGRDYSDHYGEINLNSEQELVDCDTSGMDQGCEGGLMDDAFEFIISNKGLTTESNYPYEGINGSCNSVKESNHAAWITGYEEVPSNSEAALLKAVAQQPVSVAIDAGESDFQHYSSGVFTGQWGTELDHGVTAIGYGTPSDGTKYWLVKNTWGTIVGAWRVT